MWVGGYEKGFVSSGYPLQVLGGGGTLAAPGAGAALT
jgi:hypothetical protein